MIPRGYSRWSATLTIPWACRAAYETSTITHVRGFHGDLNQFTSLQGNNLTTWHTWATKAVRVATVRDNDQRVDRVAPFPSARFPRDTTHWAIRGCPIHYSGIDHRRRGEGSSNSVTVKDSKFAGSHKSCMCQYIIKLAHRGQTIGP
jgi:hypothetical protein